jgi:hypothetical protein
MEFIDCIQGNVEIIRKAANSLSDMLNCAQRMTEIILDSN